MAENSDLNRRIIGGNIDRDGVGRKLTLEAREKAMALGLRIQENIKV